MSYFPHILEVTSKLSRQKITLEIRLNGYATCSYNPDVDVRHLTNTVLVVLIGIHISVNTEISCFSI